jgi:membrane protease subunit (stomatin/prohibitin family)
MDKRTSMGVLGDMGKYTQFEAAQAMRDAAQNPSGGAGLGAGLGAGFAVGNVMAGAMGDAMRQKDASPEVTGLSSQKCIKCGAALQAGAKFCSDCGTSQLPAKCSNCQHDLKPGAKFCDECGTKVG